MVLQHGVASFGVTDSVVLNQGLSSYHDQLSGMYGNPLDTNLDQLWSLNSLNMHQFHEGLLAEHAGIPTAYTNPPTLPYYGIHHDLSHAASVASDFGHPHAARHPACSKRHPEEPLLPPEEHHPALMKAIASSQVSSPASQSSHMSKCTAGKPTDNRSRSTKSLRHDQEEFQKDFVATASALWTTRDTSGQEQCNFPHNSDDVSYRRDQLEAIAARIQKDLRRMQIRTPGKSRKNFISVIQKGVEIRHMEMNQEGTLTRDLDIQRMKKQLKNSPCVHSLSSKTQDNRIQIEKWDTMGKAKKVFLSQLFEFRVLHLALKI